MKKRILSLLLAVSMIAILFSGCGENSSGNNEGKKDIVLVSKGVSDYVIVRGENASVSEVTASTELQSYLKQISGVELPVVTDATTAVEKEIVVAKTNCEAEGDFDREELGDDGFVIKTTGSKLWLVGGEQRGTLYSVYTFLEEYLGCRYYTATVEKIPEQSTVAIAAIEEDKQIPVFKERDNMWLPSMSEVAPKHKLNGDSSSGDEAHGFVIQTRR